MGNIKTNTILEKVSGSPDYKSNQENLTKMSTGRRIDSYKSYLHS